MESKAVNELSGTNNTMYTSVADKYQNNMKQFV